MSALVLRPSSADTTVGCTGSAYLRSLYPDADGPEAQEGTAAHWVAAERIAGRLPGVGFVAPNGVAVTQEMIDGAELWAETLASRITSHAHVEHALAMPSLHADLSGTPDAFGLGGKSPLAEGFTTLHVPDYKFGHGYVEPFENWQCLCYVSGAVDYLASASVLTGNFEDWLIVEITIVQPRNYHRDGPVRSWSVPLKLLRAHFNILRDKLAEACDPGKRKLTPGLHCKYCDARHACPALQAAALDVCDVAAEAIPFDLDATQTGGELRRLHRAAKLLDARVSGLEAQAIAQLRAGQSVPHYGLEQSQGRETWKEGAASTLLGIAQVMGKDLAKPVELITPNQARKVIDEAVINRYAYRPLGEMKLAPVDTNKTRKLFGVPKP